MPFAVITAAASGEGAQNFDFSGTNRQSNPPLGDDACCDHSTPAHVQPPCFGFATLESGRSVVRAGHRASKPLSVKACLIAGEVRNAISAFAASTCLLPELIPATYIE